MFGWKHYKHSGFGTFSKRRKGPKLTKLLSWKSVQGCVENPSKYVAQHNWTNFQRIFFCFPFFFFFYLFEKSHSPCRKKKIFEKQKQKKKGNIWTDFQLKKGQCLDGFSTLQHIYIYSHGLVGCLQKCQKWHFCTGFIEKTGFPSAQIWAH